MKFLVTLFLVLFSAFAQAQNTLFPANPGDMIVKGGASAWVPVPGGTAGCVLTSNGPTAAPTWQCALALNFQLPPMAPNTVWGNVSGAQARASQINISQFLNTLDYDVQRPPLAGAIPYKGTDNLWHTLAATGAAGRCFISGGSTAAPFFGPCATVAQALDVFMIAGQSNALGEGTAAQSCVLPSGVAYQYYNGAITSVTGDPVGGASTGSAWPCFALYYNNATNRKVLFVPVAVSGSAQAAAADIGFGNWDLTGALVNTAITQTNNALVTAALVGYAPTFKGILWAQGELDGDAINSATITISDYKLSFIAMVPRFRAVYGETMPFYLFRIGQKNTFPNSGWDQVRSGQEDLMSVDRYGRIVFRAAVDFFATGMMGVDTVHYNQTGLNFMGMNGAANIAASGTNNAWNTYVCPYNVCTPNISTQATWAQGPVGIGPGSTTALTSATDPANPPSTLYVTGPNDKTIQVLGSGTLGGSISINATSAGGRWWSIYSAANGATQCGGGTFCVWDQTAGQARFTIGATGGVRMPAYGAGVLNFDSSGNIQVVTSPFTGTKTVRASGGASDCTLVFTTGVLTGGSC